MRVATAPAAGYFSPRPLLAADEPAAVFTLAGSRPVLLLCDHASAAIPGALGTLGISDRSLLQTHIAWDIGAATVTRHLAGLLSAPAVLSGYSRLVVDLNRWTDNPTLMAEVSDGTVIPGNQNLGAQDRERRLAALYRPYHDAIAGRCAGWRRQGVVPALIAIHSFTPVMNGFIRPWQVGVLWDRDPRLAKPLIEILGHQGLCVGDNQPYSGRDGHKGTLDTHATPHGLPHVSIEIRQDLIADETGALYWADRLAAVLEPLLDDPGLYSRFSGEN